MTIRTWFIMCCVFAILILLVCFKKIKRRKESIGRVVIVILGIEITAAVASIATVLYDNYLLIALGYGVYYACMVWLCYLMVQYTCQYTKVKTHLLWIDDLWKILLVFDSVSLILNAFWRHMATFRHVTRNIHSYWVIQPKFLYKVHLVICTIMVMEVLIRFIIALIKSPVLYRLKYLSVLLMFLIIVGADIVYYYVEDAFDASMIFFAIGSTILIYATYYFVPAILRKKMLSMVFREMEDSLIMFDDKGNCVYSNNKWAQNDCVLDMKQADFDNALKDAHDKSGSLRVRYGDENHYYEDRYDKLLDENGRYIGCYYIFRDITMERKLLFKQRYLAEHDVLTGVYNRACFLQRSEELMNSMPDEQFLIVCSDIRKFKVINEVLGIHMGDNLLRLVANALTKYSGENCVYGRLEADSFALCIPEKIFDIDNFTGTINDAIAVLNINHHIINHIGIYRVDDKSLTVSAMCDRAMLAVNSIKRDYQREVVYYDDTLREQLLQEQEILGDLKQAFTENQFEIYLQPQFNHKTLKIIGAEALVRWIHPDKGIIAPNVFIPLLESNGLITKLNMHVWELACQQLQKWKQKGLDDMSVSVNISTKDFFYVDIYEVLTDLVQKYDISVANLKLEITESAFTVDLGKQLAMIEKLQSAGFIIEMDDFGSGYSSLNSLKDIPVDVLKMDMAFMSKSDRYKRSADILQMVVAMADKLNMPVIAEGVETKEQADFLSEIGCHIIQGYYYAKPMPISNFEEMLRQYNES